MTFDERAQLIEDIKKNNRKREDLAERAEADKEFDVVAAWETVEELEKSILARIEIARRG